MRHILIATAALAGVFAAAPAMAQVDRYGGVGTYAAPMAQPQSSRVLSWSGKTIPAQSPPQYGGYGYPRYVQARPAYGVQPQPAPYAQGRGAPPAPYAAERRANLYPQAAAQAPYGYTPPPTQAYPQPAQPYYRQPAYAPPQTQASFTQPYQPQPYFAPAPGAPPAAPGSTATAPSGVYPANTVPPQLAGPGALPPQVAQPLVGAQAAPPTSIYAPAPQARGAAPVGRTEVQADPTDPRQPQRVAMYAGQPQTARYYSLHRQFGLQPDPTPAPPQTAEAPTVELVSAIDSGVGIGAEPPAASRNRVVQTKGKSGTAILRGARSESEETN